MRSEAVTMCALVQPQPGGMQIRANRRKIACKRWKLFSDWVCTRNRKKIEMFTFSVPRRERRESSKQTRGKQTVHTASLSRMASAFLLAVSPPPPRRREKIQFTGADIFHSWLARCGAPARSPFLLCHSCHQLCKRSAEASANFKCMHVI